MDNLAKYRRSRQGNQQQTQFTYEINSGIRTPATLVGGKRCVTTATRLSVSCPVCVSKAEPGFLVSFRYYIPVIFGLMVIKK